MTLCELWRLHAIFVELTPLFKWFYFFRIILFLKSNLKKIEKQFCKKMHILVYFNPNPTGGGGGGGGGVCLSL